MNLLPGPASTQLAIYCAWRLRGARGAILGGLCFIVPGLVLILLLSAVFLAGHPPDWILGAAAGAGAAVPAVALNAAWGLAPASWKRIGTALRSKGPLDRLRRRGRRRRGHGRPLPGARARRLRGDRDRDPPTGPTMVTGVGSGAHPGRSSSMERRSVVSGRWPGWHSRSVLFPTAAGSSSSRSCSTTPSRRTTG